ncbi:MAG: hypothetical protein QNK19_13465 [Xanthomonadales bacterium]|nr:hypothetical protein [Xanthomonadales bacterium]
MNSRFKTNNFVALLIAVILFAIGFGLYFAHQQAKPNEQLGQVHTPVKIIAQNISPGVSVFNSCGSTQQA